MLLLCYFTSGLTEAKSREAKPETLSYFSLVKYSVFGDQAGQRIAPANTRCRHARLAGVAYPRSTPTLGGGCSSFARATVLRGCSETVCPYYLASYKALGCAKTAGCIIVSSAKLSYSSTCFFALLRSLYDNVVA